MAKTLGRPARSEKGSGRPFNVWFSPEAMETIQSVCRKEDVSFGRAASMIVEAAGPRAAIIQARNEAILAKLREQQRESEKVITRLQKDLETLKENAAEQKTTTAALQSSQGSLDLSRVHPRLRSQVAKAMRGGA